MKKSYYPLVLVLCCAAAFGESLRPQFGGSSDFDLVYTPPRTTVYANTAADPYIRYRDGVEIGSERVGSDGNALSLASADFDSDGVPDIAVLTDTGAVVVYPGDRRSIYPGADRVKPGGSEAVGLSSRDVSSNVGTGFTSIKAGDLNADGAQDLVAYSVGGSELLLLAGDGKGLFAATKTVNIKGSITVLEVGRIGRSDGLADLAVAYRSGNQSKLDLYEHPEGAFARPPVTVLLDLTATAIAITDLDDDNLGDVAVSGEGKLAFVHGSQQIYPFDLIPEAGLERPAAQVGTIKLPFNAVAITGGKFSAKNRKSLAAIDERGTLHLLEAPKAERKASTGAKKGKPKNVPSGGIGFGQYSGLRESRKVTSAKAANTVPATADHLDRTQNEIYKTPPSFRSASKKPFLDASFYTRHSRISEWTISSFARKGRIIGPAASGIQLIAARLGTSPLDGIIIANPRTSELTLLAKIMSGEVFERLSVEGEPVHVVTARLNADAQSDLIVARRGSSKPSVVLSAPANTYFVNTTDDSTSQCDAQLCTLRGAINMANFSPGSDEILFSLPDSGGAGHTIVLTSELPVITDSVTIDGTSQPGFLDSPIIEIDGSSIVAASDGLKLRTSNSTIRGLAITGFPHSNLGETGSFVGGNAITVETFVGQTRNSNNVIEGNYLGIDLTGTVDKGNASTGVLIFDGDSTRIGGTVIEARNVISGNGNQSEIGAGISIVNGRFNQIIGNFIGTDANGSERVGNSYGIDLTGFLNSVGGDDAGSGNVISGNGEEHEAFPGKCHGVGITIYALFDANDNLLTQFNFVKGNMIGTDAGGTEPLGNCSTGITTIPAVQTSIGSITDGGRNVISDNGYNAVNCSYRDSFPMGGGFCIVSGNNIGTDITGTAAMRNDRRNQLPGLVTPYPVVTTDALPGATASVGAPGGTTLGGPCTGFCNLISGNDGGEFQDSAVGQTGEGLHGVFNSYIGTDINGTAALPNYAAGTLTGNSFLGSVGFVGGEPDDLTPLGNLISGNSCSGFAINATNGWGDAPTFASVKNNLIGTDVTGMLAVPNHTNTDCANQALGVSADGVSLVQVGGNERPGEGNVISGNTFDGLTLVGNASVIGNLIGIAADGITELGNSRHGIRVRSIGLIRPNTIGGPNPGEQNLIRNNTGAGIFIDQLFPQFDVLFTETDIRENSIANNGGLGIDIYPLGVNPNDPLDADTGPNDLQNYPSLGIPAAGLGGSTTIEGVMPSSPDQAYRLDFYSSSSADPSNYGEGEAHIGSMEVTTDENGIAPFAFTVPAGVAPEAKITATATNSVGNTSEFSCVAGACVADLSVEVSDDPDPVEAGQTLTYSVLAKDLGPVSAPGTVLTIELASSVNVHSAAASQGTCSVNEQSITCLLGMIATGGQATVTVEVTPTVNGSITVDASVLSALADPDTSNNEDTEETRVGPAPIVVTTTGDESDADLTDDVCDVDQATPENQCTLRAAIEVSNARPGADEIEFDIPGGGAKTISPTSPLPVISDTVSIDATSQPGFSGLPLIELVGTNGGPDALKIMAGNSLIAGFAINGFAGNGIVIEGGPGGNVIDQNIIGTNSDGAAGIGLGGSGIVIDNSPNNRIGIGSEEGAIARFPAAGKRIAKRGGFLKIGNFLGSNRIGVVVMGSGSIGNQLAGMMVGVVPSLKGLFKLPNLEAGIKIIGAQQTKIGGVSAADRCTISGNIGPGILLDGGAGFTKILGSFIGTSAESATDIGNGGSGVEILDANETEIGGTNEDDGNYISGNGANGISIRPATSGGFITRLLRNKIGKLPSAAGVLGNQGSNISMVGDGETVIEQNTIVGSQTGCGLEVVDSNFALARDRKGARRSSPAIFQLLARSNLVGVYKNGGIFFPAGNLLAGICLEDVFGALIGGPNAGNIIGANSGPGVLMKGMGTSSFSLAGNFIGTDENGSSGLGNLTGISLIGVGEGSIGGGSGEANVISGNIGEALRALGTSNEILGSLLIKSNLIGPKPDGQSSLGNGADNVLIDGRTDTVIENNTITASQTGCGVKLIDLQQIVQNSPGLFASLRENKIGFQNESIAPNASGGVCVIDVPNVKIGERGAGNQIAGNTNAPGISIKGILARSASITANLIGSRPGGLAPLANQTGILIEGAPSVMVGGSDPADGNYISGNGLQGLVARAYNGQNGAVPVLDLSIQNNTFGIDLQGALKPNGGTNIDLDGMIRALVSRNTVAGSSTGYGIVVRDSNNLAATVSELAARLIQNRIGTTDSLPAVPAPNSQGGIFIDNVPRVTVGGPSEGNTISANNGNGITISGPNASVNNIFSNFIGTDDLGASDLGNTLHGILLTNGANLNTIGGPGSQTGNTIAFNGGSGIALDPTAGPGNNLDPNRIFANSVLGIDLNNDGVVTPNDPEDADDGPNNLQNYPVIVQTQIVSQDLLVTYTVDSLPEHSNYGPEGILVEFFKADPSGQGDVFIGSDRYTLADQTIGSKTLSLGNIDSIGASWPFQLTSTATDAGGNTSEFSPQPLIPTSSTASISGTIFGIDGSGIQGATVEVYQADGSVQTEGSASDGSYTISGLLVGRSYLIVVRKDGIVFADSPMLISLEDDLAGLDFHASP